MRIQNPEMPKEALESVRSIQKNVFSFDFFSYTDNFCIIFGFVISLIGGLIVKNQNLSKPNFVILLLCKILL